MPRRNTMGDWEFCKLVAIQYARLSEKYGWRHTDGLDFATQRGAPLSRNDYQRWQLERWLTKKEERGAVTAAR